MIQHLILLYFHQTFESSILNDAEKEEFLDLLRENDKLIVDYPWKLLYDSNKDGLQHSKFVSKVFGHPNVIMIFKINNECVIGGYTKTGWIKSFYASLSLYEDWTKDENMFVFYFKSKKNYKPFVSNIKKGEQSVKKCIGYNKQCWGTLGKTWMFYICENKFRQQANSAWNNIETFPHGSEYLTGSDAMSYYDSENVLVEVFEIDDSL